MATLQGSVVLVAGGAGAVGEGIVSALLDSGATVVVPSRDPARLDALRQNVGSADRLLGLIGDVCAPEGAGRVREQVVDTVGPPDAVITAIGGWSSGPKLADIELSAWDGILARNLRTHQVVASTYIPLLRGRPGATYGVIIGDTAEAPVAGAGPVSVTAAAELMAARSLGLEEQESGVQVLALVLGPVLTRGRPTGAERGLRAIDVGHVLARRLLARAGLRTAGPTEVLALPDRAAAQSV
ncbi:MAG: SDR family oxidoreductase [Pseudonocardiales bacterium]